MYIHLRIKGYIYLEHHSGFKRHFTCFAMVSVSVKVKVNIILPMHLHKRILLIFLYRIFHTLKKFQVKIAMSVDKLRI